MYTLALLAEAQRDLAGLDPPTARRIAKRLVWLAEHFEQVQPEALTGELSSFLKLRIGDYRVLYRIVYTEKALQVYRIRHRREIYKTK